MIASGQSSVDLLAAVVALQRQFIDGADPTQAFEQSLRLFCDLSESKLGFIGEVRQALDGHSFLKLYATHGLESDEATQAFYNAYAPEGMEFHNLENLIGSVITTGESVISSSPDTDPRSGGLPPGHPPLEAFLGLPFFAGDGKLVGMAGLANRTVGYGDAQVTLLQPLCNALGTMIVAAQRERERRANETRFQNFFDHVTDGIFLHDDTGRVVDVNLRACEILGYTREELIGMHPVTFDPVVDQAAVAANMRRLSVGESFAFDTRHRRKDGSEFPVEIRIRPVWIENRLFALALACDITERKRAEEKLREQYAILHTILESTTDYVYMKDRQGRYLTINSAAAAAVGKPVAEIIGRDDFAIFPPAAARQIRERERRIFAAEGSESFEERIPVGDQVRHLFTAKNVCRDSTGKVIGLVGITRDVTAHVQAEQALREAQQRLALILKGVDVGLWDWDLVTNEVVYSAEWKGQLGYSDDEILNRYQDWESRVHPDDVAPTLVKIRRAIDTCSADYSAEFRMRHKDGGWRWILSLGFVVADQETKPSRMLGVHIDITERKRVEEALRISEQRYRLIAELSSSFSYQATISDDYQLEFQWVGGNFFEVTGYNPEEISGLGWTRLFPNEELPGIKGMLHSLSSDAIHRFRDIELRLIVRSGEERWIRHLTHPVMPQKRGSPLTLFGAVIDITERKRAEVALRDSEARLRTMLENLDRVAVQAYEPDGTITFWNRASELFYGYSAQEALGRDLVDLLHSEQTRDEERRIMAEALCSGKPLAAEEVEVVRRDGSKITVFASRIVHTRPGKPPEFFCFDVDITDKKRAEEELAARQAELLHVSRLTTVGQMVAELAHEVAQPLSAIGNFAAACNRILDAGAEPELHTLHEYIRAIVKQNQRCVAILDRLRDYSRRTSTCRSKCDLNELLRESVDLIANDLRRNHVSVRFDLAEDLPLVLGDRIQLQQVVVNLLTNARDAMADQHEDQRWITVRSIRETSAVVFDVDDRGCGLPDEVAAHLFDPFFTTKEHGMGIGLSICQSIMKDHGGRIEAFSNPQGGATFRVRLPIAGANQDE